jgi:hypothetical protein
VSDSDLAMAKKSKVTTKNNKEFAKQVRMWGNGVYDESPDQFLNTILFIGESVKK